MPIMRTRPGEWAYKCLECRDIGGGFKTDDDALNALVEHWSSDGCAQDGVIAQKPADRWSDDG